MDQGQCIIGAAQGMEVNHNNSNEVAQDKREVQNYAHSSADSDCYTSRTRTACFSDNVNSEEYISIKRAQHARAFKDKQVTE